MVSSRVVVAGLAVAGLVGVTGCGGSSSETAGSSVPVITASSKASSPTTSASASPSSSGTAAGAPGVPEAARQHTEAGAQAFARYYVDMINETGLHPKTGVLEPLSLSTCKTCANHERTVQSNVKRGSRFNGPEFKTLRSMSVPGDLGGVYVVVGAPHVSIVSSSGALVKDFPREPNYAMVFDLDWHQGWSVRTLKYDDTVTQ